MDYDYYYYYNFSRLFISNISIQLFDGLILLFSFYKFSYIKKIFIEYKENKRESLYIFKIGVFTST